MENLENRTAQLFVKEVFCEPTEVFCGPDGESFNVRLCRNFGVYVWYPYESGCKGPFLHMDGFYSSEGAERYIHDLIQANENYLSHV